MRGRLYYKGYCSKVEDKRHRYAIRKLDDLEHILRIYVHRPSLCISPLRIDTPTKYHDCLVLSECRLTLSFTFRVHVTPLLVALRVLRRGKRLNRNPIASLRLRYNWVCLTQTHHSGVISPTICQLRLHRTQLFGAPSVPLLGPA